MVSENRSNVVVSSSFQMQSLPLLHMISENIPDIPVLFIDTGLHFPETLEFRDYIADLFDLNLHTIKADLKASDGESYETDHDLCCYKRKVEPLEAYLRENNVKVWISGVRRDQTYFRSKKELLEERKDGIMKVHPILDWTNDDINEYIREYNLPQHPLSERGYKSIGCMPCTKVTENESDSRSGRWHGSTKTECGLHLT